MINAEFLSQCSDEQINKGVAWCEVALSVDKAMASENIELYRYGMNYDISVPRHYCTDASDAWPIIVKSEMLIRPAFDGSGYWIAKMYQTQTYSKNPLRAAMEVYILMSVNK